MSVTEKIKSYLDEQFSSLVEFRRSLHKHPELSFKEFETTNKIIDALAHEGIIAQRFEKTTGLFVDIVSDGCESLPKVLIRADIDALPIQDLKDCEYRSEVPGVMHACGHDVHTTVILSVVKTLNHFREELAFNVRAIFQPAEELGKGAEALIEQGVLSGVSYALGLHVNPSVPLGKIAIRPGTINAAVISFEAVFQGKSSHVAKIHEGVDTILPSARLITESYAHVPKKIDARDPHILYFGKIISGTASNVVSPESKIMGTIRAFKSEVAQKVFDEVLTIGNAIAQSTSTVFKMTAQSSLKAVVNDSFVANCYGEVVSRVLGEAFVVRDLPASMGGEDFGAIMERVPGAMMRVGIASTDKPVYGLHTTQFDVPEVCIKTASQVICLAVLSLCEGGASAEV